MTVRSTSRDLDSTLIPKYIFLIGFMGAGKSTIGPMLAQELTYEFADLDDYIESSEGITIKEIFEQKGEDYFRSVESRVLRSFADQDQAYIIASGGGTPCYNDNMSWMNQHGLTIFLNPGLEELVSRLGPMRAHRPLLQKIPEDQLALHIGQMVLQRMPYYTQAQLHWNVSSSPTKMELLKFLKQR